MTQIAIVRGLNDNTGRTVPDKMPFVNWLTTTAGENDLVLAKQRLWLYHYIMPQKEKIWAKGATMIDNALYAGIHGATPYIGALPRELQFVAKALKFSKNKVAPAGEMLLRKHQDLSKGLDLEMVNGINGFDGFAEMKKAFPSCFRMAYNGQTGGYVQTDEVYSECRALLNFIQQFNDRIPKTAHHSIYNFIPSEELNDRTKHTQISVNKSLQHKSFVSGMQVATQVDITSLRSWLKNCVMWRNANVGLTESILPESNIDLIRKNPQWDTESDLHNPEADKIGIDPVTAYLIIICVIAAFKGIGGLIQICKNKEPSAFAGLTEIAQGSGFLASGKDFVGLGGGDIPGDGSGNGDTTKKCDPGYTYDDVLKTCVKDAPAASNDGGILQLIKDNPIPTALVAGLGLYTLASK